MPPDHNDTPRQPRRLNASDALLVLLLGVALYYSVTWFHQVFVKAQQFPLPGLF